MLEFDKDKCYPYMIGEPDTGDPENISWSIYGDYENNMLYIVMKVGDREIIESVESPVAYPAMIDRKFGIDKADSYAAMMMSSKMWQKYEDGDYD